jgi:putative ABC transport system permease protein
MVRDLGGGFGLLGAGLAALGIFSLLSYEVSRRVREIGVRQAVGADRGDVVRLVLGRCLRLVATGVALGLAAAWPAARLLASQLHGVGVHDPASYLAVPALLLALALIAAWLPAHRAASLQPLDALRHE